MYLRSLIALLLCSASFGWARSEPWIQVRTSHFVIVSNSSERSARNIAAEFEKMRSVFHQSFPKARVDASSPIIVLAVRNRRDFQALEPKEYLARGQLDLAGMFLRTPEKNYVLMRLDAEGEHPFATVYHEYTHYILSRDEELIPLWLNEGLAEFYQTTEITNKDALLGKPSVENIMLLRRNRLLPLATLFAVDHSSPYYHEEDKGSIFYAESWALTHYLEFRDRREHTHRVAEYMRLVSDKVDSVTAAVTAFGDLKTLENNLRIYISQLEFPYASSHVASGVEEASFVVKAMSPAQSEAIRADFLAYNRRVSDARSLLKHVLQLDPKNVSAYETLAYIALSEGDNAKALEYGEHAVKLDSQSYLAHYQYAFIAIKNGSPNRNESIEASLQSAIRLNPSFAPAYDLLATFYGKQRENLEAAYRLSSQAVQLEPFNLAFRINAANILVEMKRLKDALDLLDAAAKLAKDPDQLAMILHQESSIQRYQKALEKQERDYQAALERATAMRHDSEPDVAAPPYEPPDNPRVGPRRVATGTIVDVQCSPPATMHLKLAGATKPITLRTRNYYKVAFSALNVEPSANLNPCADLKAKRAKIVYYEPVGDSVEGQIIAIELRK